MTTLKMTTPKTTSPKTASLIARHFDIRLRKIRSLKTSALQVPKIVTAAARMSRTKPSIKSIVPYSLVIASLVLSGVTASEAHAAAVHATAAKPAHVITHVAHRRVTPVQQPDLFAQFFQGLFAPPMARAVRGRAEQGEYVPSDSPTYDTSTPSDDSSAASDAEAQAIQQMNDENSLIQSMQAAQEQNDEANAATVQTEINAGM
jgi:hypothetical protein